MSRSIDLFIDRERPIDEVALEVGRLTGLSLVPGDTPGTFVVEEGGVRAELGVHRFADDGDLVLEHFRFALTCRVPNDTRLSEAPETTLLRMVSEALQSGGIPTLLVHDLQYRDHPPAVTAEGPGGQV